MKVCKEQAQATCLDYPKKCYLCEAYQEQTNADRIRAMTDEELAELIYRRHTCPPGKGYLDCKISDTCDKCWVDWLQQPVKEGAE